MLPRVVILRNPAKPDAEAKMASLVEAMAGRADVIACRLVGDAARCAELAPDRFIVLGGDGSILAAARGLGSLQRPIIGVNFGKLGYLAEFSFEELLAHLEQALADPAMITRRMMIEGSVSREGRELRRGLAVNDFVLNAGPPYRMIELALLVDGIQLSTISGDGLVLATPNGSTAHNLAVGGPILQSTVRAIAVSPIAAHSLTHRPLVVDGDSTVEVAALRVNEGSSVVVDGQVTWPIGPGDRLTVGRFPNDFLLVHNPTRPFWYPLTTKLKWGM